MAFRRFAVAAEIANIAPSAAGSKKISLYTGSGKVVVSESGVPVSFDYDPENFVYFRCRAISADAPNGNGDLFPEEELKKAYKSFVGVGLYLDHDSDSVSKSIGKVLWAEWVPEGKYVECYCSVDKKLSPDMARRVEMGQASTVSMGCMVGEAMCGVEGCGNIAHNQLELCEHMMPGRGIKGKKQADGKVAFEINKLLQFTELSLVTVPADPTAKIFEVFAGLQNGTVTLEDFRKFIREEVHAALGSQTIYWTSGPSFNSNTTGSAVSTTNSFTLPLNVSLLGQPATAGISSTHAPAAAKTADAVANIQEVTEKKMKLTISYQKGTNLANSFFVGKEGEADYKVAVAEVMPVRVQEAIRAREVGVATPDQIIADLSAKCESLASFKAWAKKRKKKNRRAFEKMNEKPEEKAADAAAVAVAPSAPVAEAPAPAASTEVLNPAPIGDAAAPVEHGDAENEQAAPAAGAIDEASIEDLQQALQELQRRLDEKMSSATSSKKVAVKTESIKAPADGEHGDKAAPDPKAIQEVAKTENPKGHMDKGAALAKTAGDAKDAEWSMNPKEMEAKPKMGKPQQAAPHIVSWDGKESASEQIKNEQGSHPSKVKQFYGRLPSKGPGEPPKALDPKSSQDPEKIQLRQALEKSENEKKALLEKERLTLVANKIYEIVNSLREKNFLAAEKEDAVIEHLTTSFKDVAALDKVFELVTKLSAVAEAKEADAAADGVEVGNVVPQVFEPISQTENAIETMAKIWNL